MSYFRSYFDKNNTIIKDSTVNTAKNPNTEIFYGASFSKFIFRIDLTELTQKVNNGDVIIDDSTKHVLHLTNTIFGDESLMGDIRGNNNQRATSFDLILFQIDEYWDEGLGFDYDRSYDLTTGEALYDIRPSNWYNRTTLNTWSKEGIYTGTPTTIGIQHFDLGNENLQIDITNYINGIIISGQTNYGLGLTFTPVYEDIKLEQNQSVAFFSKYTQTFYEPYLESSFEDRIDDNRSNFIENTSQNLYLYVTKGSNFYDLDTLPLVDILDSSKNAIVGLSNLSVVKVRKGVYKVNFGLSGQICDGKRFYYDLWKNLSLDNVSINDVTQKFVPKPYTSLYTIGENQTELQRYAIQFFGIRLNEKVVRGDTRKIVVSIRSIDNPKTVLFDEVYYRIYVKEGRTQVVVYDWTQLDKTNENSFMFDTSFLIPREYTMEIKAKTHTEEIFYKNSINFEIVSEV
jgi:hypothetical protein